MFCCSSSKREPAAGTTPLKQLAQEAYIQAVQKYLEGAQEKWEPKGDYHLTVWVFAARHWPLGSKRGSASRPVLSFELARITAPKKSRLKCSCSAL